MPVKPMIAKRGFTLVEMIIVIVVLGVALVGVTTSLYPRSKQSAEQVLSVKAAELGRAVLDEVLGRAFDQHSGPNGGLPECVITETAGRTLCSAPSALGKIQVNPITQNSTMWMITSHQAQYPSLMCWVRIFPLNTNALAYRYKCFMYQIMAVNFRQRLLQSEPTTNVLH